MKSLQKEVFMHNITTKELQPEYRPDEKLITYGPETLSDAELLAVILRTGSQEENSIELARRLLTMPDTGRKSPSILNIFHFELSDLMQIKGIGKVKAVQIKAVAELALRIAQSHARSSLVFNDPEKVAAYYMEQLRHRKKETVVLLMLNSACSLIREQTVSTGTVNASLVSPREIFIEALRHEAVYILLLHNHPSGDPRPSSEDRRLTEQIRDMGEQMGIRLTDHIIIGDNRYYSFRENGILHE